MTWTLFFQIMLLIFFAGVVSVAVHNVKKGKK